MKQTISRVSRLFHPLKKILSFVSCILLSSSTLFAQMDSKAWVDSVYNSLSKEERIAQLMVVRLSSIDAKTKKVIFYDKKVADLVAKYNIGGICLFQGSPEKQATIMNALQVMAKTPILMCIDAEWGLGMRMTDSVLPLPRQMMLGAMKDAGIVYQYGAIVAEQCKRMGIQVNYAPVIDIITIP